MNSTTPEIDNIVDFIEDIFERRGADSYLGEAVTMSQHMLQSAQLAEQAGADDTLLVAALLHDIGHYTSEFPPDAATAGIDNLHDQAGARVIANWFPELVIDCIRHHVAAKRYLCAVEKTYYDDLSEASKLSLRLQGGAMDQEEVEAFAQNPNLDAILQVRRWDDLAKDPAQQTPPFAYYKPAIERVAQR